LEVLPALAALFLSSPAFQYAAAAFSFPIRLQLSQWVGALFQAMQKDVTVKGSSILMNGQEFSVDPACMGLHMLTVSLLFGIIIIGLLQKKKGVRLPAFVIISFLLLVLLLNIIANLLRMLLLIQFVILPDNPMHDVVGLLCLLVYVCIPAVWLAQKLVERFGALTQDGATSHLAFPAWLQGILLAIVLICAVRVRSTDTFQSFEKTYNASIPGYTLSVHSPGIIKMENKQSLSYIKFIRGFYDTEHNPTICWQGSGYVFQDVQESAFAGRKVYTAILVRNEEKLFTAWYYTNGETVTTSQWTWRSDLLRGSNPYAVVNVTAASKADLSRTIEHLLHQQQLKPLFDKL
jgi:exosortase N